MFVVLVEEFDASEEQEADMGTEMRDFLVVGEYLDLANKKDRFQQREIKPLEGFVAVTQFGNQLIRHDGFELLIARGFKILQFLKDRFQVIKYRIPNRLYFPQSIIHRSFCTVLLFSLSPHLPEKRSILGTG